MIKLLLIPFMMIMGRAHGGGKPDIPWGLDAFILAAPYLLIYPFVGPWVLLAYAGAVLGLRLGHGRGFHYNEPFEIGSEPEKVEYIIPDSLPVYWQKFLIMALTGLAVTLIAGIQLLLNGFILAGFVVLLSGFLKSVAYMTKTTEKSEYVRALFLALGIIAALFLLTK